MSTHDNGGPAFPAHHFDLADDEHGMTLRDYFAAKAMQAALTNATLPGLVEGNPRALAVLDEMAVAVYRIADAMLKARQS